MTVPAGEELTVICYDIADDRRRRGVVRILEGYGLRVQESVFEAWLLPARRKALEKALSGAIVAEVDRVALYVLTRRDACDVVLLGQGAALSENPSCFLI